MTPKIKPVMAWAYQYRGRVCLPVRKYKDNLRVTTPGESIVRVRISVVPNKPNKRKGKK